MGKARKAIGVMLVVACCTFVALHDARAALEWTVQKQLKLDETPVDVAASGDGKWIFVLTPGEILVYSVPDDKVIHRIPVAKNFDRLSHSAPNNTLIVSSSTEHTLKIIQLDVIQQFTLEGLPFEGPQNAPVTLVVFSDYQ